VVHGVAEQTFLGIAQVTIAADDRNNMLYQLWMSLPIGNFAEQSCQRFRRQPVAPGARR